jgi:hypothetical protein
VAPEVNGTQNNPEQKSEPPLIRARPAFTPPWGHLGQSWRTPGDPCQPPRATLRMVEVCRITERCDSRCCSVRS